MRDRSERDERGVVLVLVLLVMIALTALALSMGRDARVEIAVASNKSDAIKLRVMVESAVQRAMAELRLDTQAGDNLSEPWRDEENTWKALELQNGRVWFLLPSPDPGDGRELRYGFKDEASKLDVNTATRDQLLKIPGITEEAVDGIIDYRDPDDDVSEFGAESQYYLTLDPPYQAKNGPIESLDELLKVKGIDEAMLYGEDRNRNGLLDPGEDDGDRSFPPDDADGQLDRGLIDYLTVYARDLNRTKDNRARLNFNSAQPNELQQRLDATELDAGVKSRVMQLKGSSPGGQQPGQAGGGGQQGGISSLGEFVLRVGSSDPEQVAILLDELKLVDEEQLPGRVNINTCSKEIVAGLPGLTDEDVDAILQKRLEFDSDLSSPAWLLRTLSLQKFAGIVDSITTRSDQFTIQVVALLDDRPRFQRVEVLVDRNFAPVRILTWRDITALGFPIPGERGEQNP